MWWRVRQTEICAPDAETVFISLCSSQKPPVKYIFAGRRRRNQIRFCWSPLQHTISQQHMCMYLYPPAGLIFDLTKTGPYSTYWNLFFDGIHRTYRPWYYSKYFAVLSTSFFSLKELKEKPFFFFFFF
jgi:hypothetical protein